MKLNSEKAEDSASHSITLRTISPLHCLYPFKSWEYWLPVKKLKDKQQWKSWKANACEKYVCKWIVEWWARIQLQHPWWLQNRKCVQVRIICPWKKHFKGEVNEFLSELKKSGSTNAIHCLRRLNCLFQFVTINYVTKDKRWFLWREHYYAVNCWQLLQDVILSISKTEFGW